MSKVDTLFDETLYAEQCSSYIYFEWASFFFIHVLFFICLFQDYNPTYRLQYPILPQVRKTLSEWGFGSEQHASEKGMIYFLLFSLFPSVAMGSRCRKMAVHHKTSPSPHAPLVRQRTPYTEDSSLSPSFHPALHLTGGGYGWGWLTLISWRCSNTTSANSPSTFLTCGAKVMEHHEHNYNVMVKNQRMSEGWE